MSFSSIGAEDCCHSAYNAKAVGLIHIWAIHPRAGVHNPLDPFQLRLFCNFFETWAVAQVSGYSSALLSSYTKMSFGTKQAVNSRREHSQQTVSM